MATETSSIDDLLSQPQSRKTPDAPEQTADVDVEPDGVDTPQDDNVDHDEPKEKPQDDSDPYGANDDDSESDESENTEDENVDEYGNPTGKPKTYTEEEVNERINKAVRDRLERLQRNQGMTQQEADHVANNFEYDENAKGDWQQQLKQFIKQTYQEIGQEQQQQEVQQREQRAQQEFEQKFHQGMGRFSDFVEVVGSQPVTDAMTMGLRGIKDPAAFIYAASKRNPQELQRISQIADPYAQMLEMGKLEERMRKGKQTTKAPKPVSKTQGDASIPHKENKELSIEEQIAQSDARRLAARRAKMKR